MKGTIVIEIEDSTLQPEDWENMVEDIEEALSLYTNNYDIDSQTERTEG